MAAHRRRVQFRLTRSFDVSDLVAALRAAGWTVRRGRLQTINCAVLDTAGHRILTTGLAAFLERSGRRLSLEFYVIPYKCDQAERLLFSKTAASLNASRIIAKTVGLRPDEPVAPVAKYEKHVIPFSVSSKAGRLTLRLESIRPERPAAAPYATLVLELVRGGAAALSLAAGLIRLQNGVDREQLAGAREILSLLGLEAGPRLEAIPPWHRGDPSGPFAVAILKTNFANMLAHESGARAGLDPEYVHNMRVAIRRMRAALRMFSKAFVKEDRARFNAELRWLAKVLGEVRDLDVYIDAIPRYLSCIDADPGDYDFYLEELRARRDAARRVLLEALGSARYADFLARVQRFLSTPPFSSAKVRLQAVAASGLGRFSSEVFAAGREIATEEDMHALRIAMKRLRYAVEFLRGLAPKRMGRLAKTASRYQDILGRFNDAVVACGRVRKAVREDDRDKIQAFLLGYLLACQRLAAMDAKYQFFRRWRAKGAKRLWQAIKSALQKF